METEIEILHTKGNEPGPHLVLFGCVHGNEPATTAAIRELHKTLVLTRGQITFVPVANPDAYAAGKRYLEEDLNRVFRKTENPQSYEARLANQLTAIVDDADFLLDIHSFAAPGHTCVFVDYPTEQNQALAKQLGAEYALVGWPKMYEESPIDSYDTTRYASEVGRDGLLVECGQHADPQATARAVEFVMRTLQFFNMVTEQPVSEEPVTPPQTVRMTKVFTKEHEGDTFAHKWQHLEPVSKGTIIATRGSGELVTVERDSLIMLPKHNAPVGGEWFYLGHLENSSERV